MNDDVKTETSDNLSNRFQLTIEASNKLLETENIALIVYIDDKFDISGQKEFFIGRLKSFKRDGLIIESGSFKEFKWDSPDAKFDADIDSLWEKAIDKRVILHELFEARKDDESANILPTLEIEECFKGKIRMMTPDEWFDDKYSSIKALKKGERALCLFDFEFQNGNTKVGSKNGAHLAKELIDQKDLSKYVICGIFSHKFLIEEENECRSTYAKDYSIEKTKFYTISKYRFSDEPRIAGFAEGIKNLLLHPHVEKLKTEALKVLRASNRKATENVKNISPESFNQIIQKSSLMEGVWEVSTLFRLYGILSKKENFNTIADPMSRKKFNSSINHIRTIDEIDTGYNSLSKNKQLSFLRNSELYLSDKIVNKLHLPLSNGDIFEIGGKEYVLLVQPCNLALRAERDSQGKRNYGYDAGIIVPLKNINPSKVGIMLEPILTSEQTEQVLVADFPAFRTISLLYLDLVVFDEQGEAKIDLNETSFNSEVIHFPWKKRYKYIYKHFKKLEDRINEFKPVEEAFIQSIEPTTLELEAAKQAKDKPKIKKLKKEIAVLKRPLENSKKAVHEIDEIGQFGIDCTKIYEVTPRTFNLRIKRKRHYKSPYSDDLLQKFMLYMSRNAFDHDFSRV